MKKHAMLVLLPLGLLLTVGAAAQSDSALVQAAKQKATEKKARRVFTNEDYPERPDLTPSVAATANASTAADAKATDAKATEGKEASTATPDPKAAEARTDEKAPEAKPPKQAELEKKLETSKREEQDLRQKLDKLQEKANNEASPNRRAMYFDMISNQQTTLSEYRQQQESLEKQIEEEKNKKSE